MARRASSNSGSEKQSNPVDSRKMSFQRYIRRYGKAYDHYKVAYVEPQYRGIIKEKREWDSILPPMLK